MEMCQADYNGLSDITNMSLESPVKHRNVLLLYNEADKVSFSDMKVLLPHCI